MKAQLLDFDRVWLTFNLISYQLVGLFYLKALHAYESSIEKIISEANALKTSTDPRPGYDLNRKIDHFIGNMKTFKYDQLKTAHLKKIDFLEPIKYTFY